MLTNTSAQVRFLMNVVKAGKTAVLVYHAGCLSACVCVRVENTLLCLKLRQEHSDSSPVPKQPANLSIHARIAWLCSVKIPIMLVCQPFFLYSRKLEAFKWLIPYFLPLVKFHHMLCLLQYGVKTRTRDLTYP